MLVYTIPFALALGAIVLIWLLNDKEEKQSKPTKHTNLQTYVKNQTK